MFCYIFIRVQRIEINQWAPRGPILLLEAKSLALCSLLWKCRPTSEAGVSSTRCHIHTHICTHTQTQVYAQIHAHSCKHIHKHIYTHTHTLAVSSVILACIATKIVSISRMLGVGASCACAWKCSSSCTIHSFLFWAQLRAVYFRVPDVIFGSTPSSLCTALRTAGIHPWRQTEDRRLQSYCSILQLLKPFGNW